MRTTLTIDDDVLVMAKRLAAREQKTVGEVISTLARQGMRPPRHHPKVRNGVPLLPLRPDATAVTPEMVNRLRDDFHLLA